MDSLVVGLSTGSFYRMSVLDALEGIRDSGFRLIEIGAHPQHLDYHDGRTVHRTAETILRLGLQPFSFHAPFGGGIDITSLDHREREYSVEEILTSMRAAFVLGARHLVLHPGPDIEKIGTEEHGERLRNAVHALQRITPKLRELSMELVLENMLPHLVLGQPGDIPAIIRALAPMKVWACLDTGHAYLGGDLFGTLSDLAPNLRMVHTSDNLGARDDHLPPGKGHIDWRRLLASLRDLPFEGPLILELDEKDGSPEKALEQARATRRMLEEGFEGSKGQGAQAKKEESEGR